MHALELSLQYSTFNVSLVFTKFLCYVRQSPKASAVAKKSHKDAYSTSTPGWVALGEIRGPYTHGKYYHSCQATSTKFFFVFFFFEREREQADSGSLSTWPYSVVKNQEQLVGYNDCILFDSLTC